MKVYHGSTVVVDHPEIRRSENFLDFGTGFYTTTSFAQAQRWATIKMRRLNAQVGYVSVYEFDEEAAAKQTEIFRFENADIDWLNFVVGNRRGDPRTGAKDLYIGPVADDNVYRTIRLFETGVYDAEETVKRLKTEVLRDQWVFCSDRILSCLSFLEAKEIKEGGR